MTEPKGRKPASNYHSPLRARQAAETRRAITDAALDLFSTQGWAATSLPSIAAAAGVSVDTIYSTFGTKSALLMDVVHVAIVGDDDAQPMVDRDDFAQFAQGRRHERLRTGVRYTMSVYERSIPILETLPRGRGQRRGGSRPTHPVRPGPSGPDRSGCRPDRRARADRGPHRCLLGAHQPRGLPLPDRRPGVVAREGRGLVRRPAQGRDRPRDALSVAAARQRQVLVAPGRS